MRYDAYKQPDPQTWLELDESDASIWALMTDSGHERSLRPRLPIVS